MNWKKAERFLLIFLLISTFLLIASLWVKNSLDISILTFSTIFLAMIWHFVRARASLEKLEKAAKTQKTAIGIRLFKLSLIFATVAVLFTLGSLVLLLFEPSLYSSLIKTFGTKFYTSEGYSCIGLVLPDTPFNAMAIPLGDMGIAFYCLDLMHILTFVLLVTLFVFFIFEFRKKSQQ
jgi:hypothetical protein